MNKLLSVCDVVSIWKICIKHIKTNFPNYYNYISKYYLDIGRSKTCFGWCDYEEKSIVIHMYLSKYVSKKELKDTILHEIAHAISYEKFDCDGHGGVWKKVAKEIGARPEATCPKYDKMIVPSKYVYLIKIRKSLWEFQSTLHKKSKYTPLNELLPNVYIPENEKKTLNKMMLVRWDDFIKKYKNGQIKLKDYYFAPTIL